MTELKYNLSTGNTGVFQIVTPEINGELQAVIVSNVRSTYIQILSEIGYPLFQRWHEGSHYLPITISQVSPSGNQRNFGASKFKLKEKLIINVSGAKNERVLLILRYV